MSIINRGILKNFEATCLSLPRFRHVRSGSPACHLLGGMHIVERAITHRK